MAKTKSKVGQLEDLLPGTWRDGWTGWTYDPLYADPDTNTKGRWTDGEHTITNDEIDACRQAKNPESAMRKLIKRKTKKK